MLTNIKLRILPTIKEDRFKIEIIYNHERFVERFVSTATFTKEEADTRVILMSADNIDVVRTDGFLVSPNIAK